VGFDRLAALVGNPPPETQRQGPGASGTGWSERALLPARRNRTVVILGDTETGDEAVWHWLDGFGGDRVSLLGAPGSRRLPIDHRIRDRVIASAADDEVEWFVQHGPVDVVVDLRGVADESRRARWNRLFLLLRTRGAWVVARAAATDDLRREERDWLEAVAAATEVKLAPRDKDVDKECVRSVGTVTAREDLIVLRKRLRHVAKLRPGESDTTLRRRDPDVSVETLMSLPAARFASPSTVISHRSAITHLGLSTTLDVPELALRHYTGRLAYGCKMLTYTQHSILNDSFRFYHSDHPVNPNTWDFTPRIARIRHPFADPAACLVGDYYLIDPQFSGHFGHVMTEMIGRLWAWDFAKRHCPGLKVLLQPWPDSDVELERTLLNAYGIADEDIVLVERPVYVQSLYSADIMWHNWPPYFAHPQLADIWRRLSKRVLDPTVARHEKIFVSRADVHDRRRCRNAAEVEKFFAERGFAIIYPELYDIGEQAAIFAHARTVAGFAGSAMFNVLYAHDVETVIVLAQEAYTARNELLYTLVLGCDMHYFWSSPKLAQPGEGWTLRAYESEWSFDFERNRADLEAVLANVD
jgi:capsular polysaccharide biosynthesis protein